jgi:uncharacterized integral membrane protein
MRMIRAACIGVVLLAGALFGALNTAPATIDFHFAQVTLPLGLALLLALLAGWILGGLTAWLACTSRRRPGPARDSAGTAPAMPAEAVSADE